MIRTLIKNPRRPKIRVAIIGSGSICRHRHAPEYAAHPDAQIVAFADRVPLSAPNRADKFGGKAYDRWQDVLALKDVDAVSVCTPNALHAPSPWPPCRPASTCCARSPWLPPTTRPRP